MKNKRTIERPDLFGLLDELRYTSNQVKQKADYLDSLHDHLVLLTQFNFVGLPAAQDMIREMVKNANQLLDSFGRMHREIAGQKSVKLLK